MLYKERPNSHARQDNSISSMSWKTTIKKTIMKQKTINMSVDFRNPYENMTMAQFEQKVNIRPNFKIEAHRRVSSMGKLQKLQHQNFMTN